MLRRQFLRLIAAPLLFGLAAASATAAEPLTIMSFNIRYGTANDGDNQWSLRREFLFEVLRQEDADLVGLQEALDFQIREIAAALPQYSVIGVGRDDGKAGGEHTAILARRDRFHVAEAGTFWFSDTPLVPGSKSWGNRFNRICTWARLIDRDGSAFWIYNLHLDHESQPSRERSTALLAQHIHSRRTPEEPVVVTGDFNASEDNPAIATLIPAMFVDTYRVLNPDATDVATFNGFKVGPLTGPKIDYVLVQPGTEVLSAAIVRTAREGRYPSDHFPVVARVRLRAPGRAAPHR
ncbi:MAG TPA: endonuclease/exonuclease/phosphatase family protein [Vicinamibacterales bacterium]|nr:endonuclease/exonuclease/phosphatase family protein [Vicinamibacterales bacterium]